MFIGIMWVVCGMFEIKVCKAWTRKRLRFFGLQHSWIIISGKIFVGGVGKGICHYFFN